MIDASIEPASKQYKKKILTYIAGSKPVGDFANGGERPCCSVIKMEVEEVGNISFPLHENQAKLLISKARIGPFGKGTKTIVDTNVRKVWEIQKEKVILSKEFITGLLPNIVNDSCAKLGLSGDLAHIKANLYKLLIYEDGGFFKKHKDTEKEDGMFGTLLIQLPALHTGGDLVVKHMGKVKRFTHSIHSDDRIYYNAFFTDCEHELEPVTSGYRMVLAFNLVKTVPIAAGSRPRRLSATNFTSGMRNMESAINDWVADNNNRPNKLAYKLDHKYTLANIAFESLKGRDKEIYDRLCVLKDKFGDPLLSIKMVIMEKIEYGCPEDYYGYGHWPNKMGHVCQSNIQVLKWIHEEGDEEGDGKVFGNIDLNTDFLDPKQVMFSKDHDGEDFEDDNLGMLHHHIPFLFNFYSISIRNYR